MVLEKVTVPVLLLVRVKPELMVAAPPKVMLLAPANCLEAVQVTAPVPLLKVVPLMVISPAKLVTGF